MRAVSRALAAGRIGEPRYIAAQGKGYYGGYDLMSIGTHVINAMLEVAGPCVRVVAAGTTGGHLLTSADVIAEPSGMGTIAGENLTTILLFAGGMSATLTHHRQPSLGPSNTGFVVHGTEGEIAWHTATARLISPHSSRATASTAWEELPIEDVDVAAEASDADYYYANDYVTVLDADEQHRCSGHEGRHVLEIMMAIFESAAEGHAVDLPQVERGEHPLLCWRRQSLGGALPEMPRPYPEWLEVEDRRTSGA